MKISKTKPINSLEELRNMDVGDFVSVKYPKDIFPHPFMVYEGIINVKYSLIRPYREDQGRQGNPTNFDIFYRRYREENISFNNGELVFVDGRDFGIYKFDDLSEEYLKRARLIDNIHIWRGFFGSLLDQK